MTDLTAYRHLFRRTGVEHTEYLWPRIFSDPVTKFWHIPEDAVTGLAISNVIFLFDERNKLIGTSSGDRGGKIFERRR